MLRPYGASSCPAIRYDPPATPVWSRSQPSPVIRGIGGLCASGSQKLHGFPSRCPSPTRCQACSRPDSTELPIGQPSPFAYACDASELPAHSRGVRRQSHSRGLSSLRHPSTPEAPFLDGHYPASSVLRASPPPCRPGLPLAGFRLPRATAPTGLPVLLRIPSSTRADAPTPAETSRLSRRSLSGQSAAFPFPAKGRLPRLMFRGLLGVHSRFGPRGR